jgi:hypothetical protein
MIPLRRSLGSLRGVSFAALSFLAAASVCLPGCKDDAKKDLKAESTKAPEKIPEDFVINDFFKEGKGARPIVEAGAVPGIGSAAGSATGPSAAASGATGGAPSAGEEEAENGDRKFKIVEPGSEPRVARRYAFKAQSDTRVMTLKVTVVRDVGGKKQEQAQPPLTMTLAVSPKPAVAPKKGAVLEVSIKKFDQEGLDKARAAAAQQVFKGLGVIVEVSPRGGLGELKFAGQKPPQGSEEVVQLLVKALEILVAPLPEEPIGVGAKWKEEKTDRDRAVEIKTISTCQLKDWTGEAGGVECTVERSIPKSKTPQGVLVSQDMKDRVTFQISTHSVASKVDAELVNTEHAEVPGQGKIDQTSVVKISIETPAAGK